MYHAVVGQFMQRDPVLSNNAGLYAYVKNSPLVFVDPTGEQPVEQHRNCEAPATPKNIPRDPCQGTCGPGCECTAIDNEDSCGMKLPNRRPTIIDVITSIRECFETCDLCNLTEKGCFACLDHCRNFCEGFENEEERNGCHKVSDRFKQRAARKCQAMKR